MKPPHRSYEQLCALALALDRVGERWQLLVVRELLSGPKRFVDLLEGMPGVATNTLTARLAELQDGGVVQRHRLAPPVAGFVYELTKRGRALEPLILGLARWGHEEIRSLRADPKRAETLAPVRAGWLGLALKAYFKAPSLRVSCRLQLRMPTGDLAVTVKQGALELTYGALENVEATLTAPEDIVLGLLTGDLKLRAAARAGLAKVDGSERIVEQALRCFPLLNENGAPGRPRAQSSGSGSRRQRA